MSEFSLVTIGSSPTQWIHTRSRRIHVHDVRCIGIWPPAQLFPRKHMRRDTSHDRNAPILVTGGLDMTLTLSAIAPPSGNGPAYNPFARGHAPSLDDAFYRKMSYAQLGASGGRIVQCAPQARYVICRHDTKISIWLVEPRRPNNLAEPEPSPEAGWKKLLDMDLKVDTTLVASAISPDGKWLSVSDAYETKLFRLVSEVRICNLCGRCIARIY